MTCGQVPEQQLKGYPWQLGGMVWDANLVDCEKKGAEVSWLKPLPKGTELKNGEKLEPSQFQGFGGKVDK